jgi:hypothetical protein
MLEVPYPAIRLAVLVAGVTGRRNSEVRDFNGTTSCYRDCDHAILETCLLPALVLGFTLDLKISGTLDFGADLLVDLVGIEPTTSSMPWSGSKSQIIDGTIVMSRHNRPNRRYLLPKCCQIQPKRATGLIVWNQPFPFLNGAVRTFYSGTVPSLRILLGMSWWTIVR